MESQQRLTLILCALFFVILLFVYFLSLRRIKQLELKTYMPLPVVCPNQTVDIWSISGNRQNSSESSSWPTHDTHVSIDSFVISADRMHVAKPPPYSELDLPTYEEATRIPPASLEISHERQPRASS